MKHAKQYFDNHAAAHILYFTSDGLAFFEEQNAISHGRRLADKTITVKTREEVDEEIEQLANENEEDDLFYDPYEGPDGV